jgi:L-threonylcarbamoyladenylate synthase
MIISVTEAVAKLQTGGIVAIPTETVYGLAGRIDDEGALKQIFTVKQRPFFDPLIVHVSDLATAKRLAREWPPVFDVLAAAFWPGPLTLIAPKAELVSSLITSGLDTVALRWPNHPVALEILRALQIPLAAPSANLFGRTSPTAAAHVEKEFAGQVPVVDGGPSEVGVESTVVSFDPAEARKLQILRPGGISRAQIQKALLDAGVQLEVVRAHSEASPGHLKSHYQPNCPVVILDDKAWSEDFRKTIEAKLDRPFPYVHEMKLGPSAQLAARRLYEEFRQFSEVQGGLIVITRSKENSGLEWEAVWDRIERAASFIF